MHTLPIDQIANPLRLDTDPALKQQYCAALQHNQGAPPIRVALVADGYALLDGINQLQASRDLGLPTIDALIAMPTRAEKQALVVALLTAPDASQDSAREIARRVGVSHSYVNRLRRSLLSEQLPVRQVRRGRQTYVQRVGQRQEQAVPELHILDKPYLDADLPARANVILTAPPVDANQPISAWAERMAEDLDPEGRIYLWFEPQHLGVLADWQRALFAAGLGFSQVLCWHVTGRVESTPLLPEFELILSLTFSPLKSQPFAALRGPRSAVPVEKPLWLLTTLLHPYVGQVALDPFMQSDRLVQAAKRAGVSQVIGCKVNR